MADPMDLSTIRQQPPTTPLVLALAAEVELLRTCVSDLRATDSRRHFTQTPAWPYQEHRCQGCLYPWPCPDERARRAALDADR